MARNLYPEEYLNRAIVLARILKDPCTQTRPYALDRKTCPPGKKMNNSFKLSEDDCHTQEKMIKYTST